MNRQFLRAIQRRTARVAVGPSAARGLVGGGVVAAARKFMATLRLRRFGTGDRLRYARQLDRSTEKLMRALPRKATSWGLSRKLLNIFLRDCLYTTHLSKAYGLVAAEEFFEIPLDSITAQAIRTVAPELPRWRGVKYLDSRTSLAYQTAALMIARERGLVRVHLDAYWWGSRD